MSTDFALYALDDDEVPMAKAYAASSLGYGNADFNAIVAAAGNPHRMDIFMVANPARFTIERGHTMHDDDETCTAHRLSDFINEHPYAVITEALTRQVLDLVGKDWSEGIVFLTESGRTKKGKLIPATWRNRTPEESRIALESWLDGANGRALWYVYE